jgi:hypothetical protein
MDARVTLEAVDGERVLVAVKWCLEKVLRHPQTACGKAEPGLTSMDCEFRGDREPLE